MKTTLLLIVPVLLIIAVSTSNGDQASSQPTSNLVRFLVTLSEYQLAGFPPSASEADILESIRKTGAKPTETTRLSVIKDVEGMVKFGRLVAVTAGKTVNREGVTMRQTRDVQVGTLLKVILSLEGEAVMAKIAFEASRFQGEVTEDSNPDLASATVNTNQLIELDKPCLIGSTSSGKSTYNFITVTKLP